MFDLIHNNKRVIQVILALIMLPFAFFGIDSYFRSGDTSTYVATLGDQKITQQEFGQALRDRQDAMRNLLGGGRIDPAMLDNPQLRSSVLDNMIQQRLLTGRAVRLGLTVSDTELQRMIAQAPAFQLDGKFSLELYKNFLRSRGISDAGFENQVRRDLMIQQMADAFSATGFVAANSVDRLLRLSEQQREVSLSRVPPDTFIAQVKLEPNAARAYYDSHTAEFQVPEQARVEYVVLSLDGVAAQTQLAPDEVNKFYEANREQLSKRSEQPEQRQASHILVKVDANAGPEAKAKARAAAEALLKQARDKPGEFAELAKKNSQDPGSAESGGDLGLIGRGMMVKPFEEAVFGMKTGEIAGPVETQFGYHIIKLTGIQAGKAATLDDVRGQIEGELKRQKAGKKFAESAETLNNLTYEQSDSLKPAAEALKLNIQRSPWISRKSAQGAPFDNEKMISAVFSSDVLKDKRNSAVIEVAPNTLVAARVLEHKPAALRPFEEVSNDIARRLTEQQAAQLAAKAGRARLEKLKQGDDGGISWSPAQLVGRQRSTAMSEGVLKQVFRTNPEKLPAYAGVDDPQGGFTLIKLNRVIDPASIGEDKRKSFAGQLQQLTGQEELRDYVSGLKSKSDVKVKQELLEKSER